MNKRLLVYLGIAGILGLISVLVYFHLNWFALLCTIYALYGYCLYREKDQTIDKRIIYIAGILMVLIGIFIANISNLVRIVDLHYLKNISNNPEIQYPIFLNALLGFFYIFLGVALIIWRSSPKKAKLTTYLERGIPCGILYLVSLSHNGVVVYCTAIAINAYNFNKSLIKPYIQINIGGLLLMITGLLMTLIYETSITLHTYIILFLIGFTCFVAGFLCSYLSIALSYLKKSRKVLSKIYSDPQIDMPDLK